MSLHSVFRSLAPLPGIEVDIGEKALHVRSLFPFRVLSSAVVGGELEKARHILNMRVPRDYAGLSPEQDLLAFAEQLGIYEPFIGLMTAVRIEEAGIVVERFKSLTVIALATVGLGYPGAAGVSPPAPRAFGTINVIVLIEGDLSPSALVNAVITATEAKVRALWELEIQAPEGGPATGTSTDAIVIGCTGRGETLRYAGPVTEVGWLIGRAVRAALVEGRRCSKRSSC